MPLGSVPVLTVNGKQAVQSLAILRYVGKLCDLYPEDPWEALIVDEVMDTNTDFFQNLFSSHGLKNEDLKAARQRSLAEAGRRYCGGLEKILSGTSDGPFVLGQRLSIADLIIANLFLYISIGDLQYVPPDALSEYKILKRVFDSVMDLPQVKEYYDKHPIRGVAR